MLALASKCHVFTCVRHTRHAVRMGGGGVSAKNREAVALPVHGSGAVACRARMRGLRGRRAHTRRVLWGHAPSGYAPQVCGSPSRRAPYFTCTAFFARIYKASYEPQFITEMQITKEQLADIMTKVLDISTSTAIMNIMYG